MPCSRLRSARFPSALDEHAHRVVQRRVFEDIVEALFASGFRELGEHTYSVELQNDAMS